MVFFSYFFISYSDFSLFSKIFHIFVIDVISVHNIWVTPNFFEVDKVPSTHSHVKVLNSKRVKVERKEVELDQSRTSHPQGWWTKLTADVSRISHKTINIYVSTYWLTTDQYLREIHDVIWRDLKWSSISLMLTIWILRHRSRTSMKKTFFIC